jgi:hypothetical protein
VTTLARLPLLGALAVIGAAGALLAAGPAAAGTSAPGTSAAVRAPAEDPAPRDDAGIPGLTPASPVDTAPTSSAALPARELAIVLFVAGAGTLLATRAVRVTRRRP